MIFIDHLLCAKQCTKLFPCIATFHCPNNPVRLCYGLNHVPRKTRYVEVLIPNISEWGVIWNQDLCRFNQVRMRLLGWTLIQYGEIWTQTYLEGRQCKGRITWRQKFGVMHLQAKEDQRLLANHHELGRSKEGFFLQVSEGAWPWWYPDFGLLASRTVRWQISVLSHPVACGNPRKLTQVGTSSSPFHRAAASGKGGKNRESGTFSGFSTLYSWHLDQQQKENWEMVKQWASVRFWLAAQTPNQQMSVGSGRVPSGGRWLPPFLSQVTSNKGRGKCSRLPWWRPRIFY